MKAVLCLLAAATVAFGAPDRRKPTPETDNLEVTIKWCRQYNNQDSCGEKNLTHGQCYDYAVIDPLMDDNMEEISTMGGNCVVWQGRGCHGDHTGKFVGENLFLNNMCDGYGWGRRGSSIRCCAGDPGSKFCGDPEAQPECTGNNILDDPDDDDDVDDDWMDDD